MAKMIDLPSNNHAARGDGVAVDTLVLHHTAQPLDVSLELLRFGAVSAHYLVDVNGDVYRLVDEARVAWHAGLSWWRAARGLNATSIGIEIVNPDGNRHAYPDAQRDAVIALCRGLLARHPVIAPRNVVGHSDIAPQRKDDPGRLFFWRALAAEGVGLWSDATGSSTPDDVAPAAARTTDADLARRAALATNVVSASVVAPATTGPTATDVAPAPALLRRFGYPPPHRYGRRDGRFVYVDGEDHDGVSDLVEVTLADIVTAFQRHYRPSRIDGVIDAQTTARLRDLLRQAGEADG